MRGTLAPLLIALGTLASNTAHADDLSLAQVLRAAAANTDVALATHSWAASQADVAAADHAPLPVVNAKLSQMDLQNGLGAGNLLTDKRIDKSLGVDWTWERGDKRRLRTEAAQHAADAARADLDDARLQQLLAAQGAFYDLLAAQERITEAEAIATSAEQLAQTAERRAKAGDLAAQDASRTQIEAQRARADATSAHLDARRFALALWQITGLGRDGQARVRSEWPAISDASSQDVLALVDDRPDVRAARARVQAARLAFDSATAQKATDLTVGASIDHFPGTSTRQVELRVQFPLQAGYGYEGEIRRAQAQLAQAEDTLDKTRRVGAADLQRMQAEAHAAAQRARSYDEEILPRARRVAEMAEVAFSKGAMPLFDLLDARRTLRSTSLEGLAARADYARAAGALSLRTQPASAAAAIEPAH